MLFVESAGSWLQQGRYCSAEWHE